MYAREAEGYPRTLTFGVSGKLIMNVLVMYDRQTETLWSQILGEAVRGPLAGTKLEPLTATQTTWGEWRSLHTDTVALDKGPFARSRDSYANYYSSGSAGVLGTKRADPRLPLKEIGLGMVIDGQPAYYSFSRLSEAGVVNDTVAGQPLLVVYRRDVATALAFSREVSGEALIFDWASEEDFTLVDRETGTRWSAWTGGAINGSLSDARLERVPATTSFWFGWSDWHPDTYIYGHEPQEDAE